MNLNDQDIEQALKSLKKDTSSEWESSALGHLQEMSKENVTDKSNLRINLRDQHGPSIFYSFFNTPMKRLFTTFGTLAVVFVLALGLQAGFDGATPTNSFAYSVDRSFERIELVVARLGGKDSVAQKHLDHANERIEEIDSILESSGTNLLSFGSLFIQTAYAQGDSFFDIQIQLGPLLKDYEQSLGKAVDLIPELQPEKAAKIIGELTSTVRGITRVVGEHTIKGSKFDLNPINEEVQKVILRVAEKTKNAGTGMVPQPDDQEEDDEVQDCFDDAGNEIDCPEDDEEKKDDQPRCFDETGSEIDCPDDEDEDDDSRRCFDADGNRMECPRDDEKDDPVDCFDDAGNEIDCPEDEGDKTPSLTLNNQLEEAVNVLEEEVKINEEILKKLAKGSFLGNQDEEGGEEGLVPVDPFILEHLFAGPAIGRLGLDPNAPCSDTDNGQDKFVRGIVQRGEVTSEDVCFDSGSNQQFDTEIVSMDLSSDPNAPNGIVQEYYCARDSKIKTALYNCDNGCSQGACQKPPTFDLSKAALPAVVEVCVDTDGGGIGQEYIKGQATIGNAGGGDYCNPNGGMHLETMCENGEYATKQIQCPNGCTDDEGACKKPEVTAESADPSSVSVSPSSGGVKVSPVAVSSDPLELGGCYDTDAAQGANQIFTKGSVSDANFKDYADACTGGVVLFEQTCVDGKVKLPADDYECEYGCEDGRCLSKPVDVPVIKEFIEIPSVIAPEEEETIVPVLVPKIIIPLATCNDTDGGKDYFTQGSTSNGETNLPDKCNDNTLYEYFCDGNSRLTSIYSCEYGCDAGRCNSAPAISPSIIPDATITPEIAPEVLSPSVLPQLNLTR